MFGAASLHVNFTIDQPIISPRSTASAAETVRPQVILTRITRQLSHSNVCFELILTVQELLKSVKT